MIKLKFIRKHNELLVEILVFSLYMASLFSMLLWLINSHFEIATLFEISDKVELNLDSITSFISIVAAAIAIIISNRQAANKALQSEKDQTYQQLELESINLFRFEIENVKLARIIWDDAKSYKQLQSDEDEKYKVLQHLCQILNLFEMAVRFKHNNVSHNDVFASWVAWIYDLCKSELFMYYWYQEGVKDNYIGIFQEMIEAGLCCSHGEDKVSEIIRQLPQTKDSDFEKFKRLVSKKLDY